MFAVSEVHTQTHINSEYDLLLIYKCKFHASTVMCEVHLGKVKFRLVTLNICSHGFAKKTFLALSRRKFYFFIKSRAKSSA